MALAPFFESTLQTVGATEFSFPSNSTTRVPQTAVGEFYVLIDVQAFMVAGDQFQFRLYEKIGGSGATQRVMYEETPTGLQSKNIIWGPVALRNGWDVTGVRVLGSDRVIPISIFQITSDVNVTSIANGAIAAASFAAGAITSTVISAAAIGASQIASAALTAAKFAADAIDGNAVAASAISEIQSGLASSSAVASVQSDTTSILGRVDVATSTRSPASTAVSNADLTPARAAKLDNLDAAVTTRATAAAVATLQGDTDDIRSRLPAELDVGGNMPAAVQSIVTDAVTGDALASSAAIDIAAAVWSAISEGTEAYGDAIRNIAARLFGKATVPAGDGTYRFRNADDSKDRLVLELAGTARNVTTRDGA
jgi:hypothetical protein